MSAAIISGRRRTRSTQTPANRPSSSSGAAPAAPSSPICSGDAPSTRIAVYGSASRVTVDPNRETVWPAHSRIKSWWRHKPPKRDRAPSPASRFVGSISPGSDSIGLYSFVDRTCAVTFQTQLCLPFDPSTRPSTSSGGASGQASSGRTAAWYFPLQLLFVFSLAERKNEQQKEDNVPLCMTTSGHRVSPVIENQNSHGQTHGRRKNDSHRAYAHLWPSA